MSTPNPRKRPAPGSPPVPNMPQYNGMVEPQIAGVDALSMDPNFNPLDFADFGMAGLDFAGMNGASHAMLSPRTMPQTTLARRPISTQMVQTTPRTPVEEARWNSVPTESGGEVMPTEHNSIEALEEQAARVRRDAKASGGSRKQIPPFVQKLSSFLDESKNTDLIRWSDNGDSFIVLDEDEFARTLIPELFKHNNYASFVRQLNMYGFHKRVGLSDNSMRASERKNKSPSEYYNPYFKRGHPNLLWLINKPPKSAPIKRAGRKAVKNDEGKEAESEDEMDGVEETFSNSIQQNNLHPYRAISSAPAAQLPRRELTLQKQLMQVQQKQELIIDAMRRMQMQYNQLNDQSQRSTQMAERHDSSINAILTFLASVYHRSLDPQTLQALNLGHLFQGGEKLDEQRNGSVVEMEDSHSHEQPKPTDASPPRKTQRLLMAPPAVGSQGSNAVSGELHRNVNGAGTASPLSSTRFDSASPRINNAMSALPRQGTIEEIFETPSASNSPQPPLQHDIPERPPSQDILNLMASTRPPGASAGTPPSNDMADLLSSFPQADDQALTDHQRQSMLSMINNTNMTPPGRTDLAPVLASPTPSNTMDNTSYTHDMDELLRMQDEASTQLLDISKQIEDGSFSPDLDMNQFLADEAFYADPSDSHSAEAFANADFDNDLLPADGFGFSPSVDATADTASLSVPEKQTASRSTKRRKA